MTLPETNGVVINPKVVPMRNLWGLLHFFVLCFGARVLSTVGLQKQMNLPDSRVFFSPKR